MARSIDDVLAAARSLLGDRPDPAGVERLANAGALIVDIRPIEQRLLDGEFPGAVVIGRNVLEWRLDPQSSDRIKETSYSRAVVVVCHEGYSSSLAAATLVEIGLDATDLDGGVVAWLASGRSMA